MATNVKMTDLEIPAFLDKRTKTPQASPPAPAHRSNAQPSSLSSQAAPADAQVGGASLTGEKEHAHKSPSSFKRLMLCPGSFVLSKDEPDAENEHSRSGSIAHAVAAYCLEHKIDADGMLFIDYKGKTEIVPMDMRERVQGYLDNIRERANGHTLLIEQRLELSWLTDEPNAYGTADAVILHADGKTLEIWDYKDGFIFVDAENNSQIRIYAMCAARQFDMVGDYENIVSGIHQPRIDNIVSETLSLAQLADFEQEVRATLLEIEKAEKSNSLEGFLHPSEDACKYCKAKHKCPALANQVSQVTGADFQDETQDSLPEPVDAHAALLKADLIETWIKGCRAKVEADLLVGKPSRHWKLVEGKAGNRAWIDEAAVAKVAAELKLDATVTHKSDLRTPADMEKKLKKNPTAWAKMVELYTKKKGKPSVAAISDPRAKYDPKPGEDFSEVVDDE